MDGDFDLAMRITGDASSAVDAAGKTSIATLSLEAAQAKAAVAAVKLSTAQDGLAASVSKGAAAQTQAAAALSQAQLGVAQASLAVEKASLRASGATDGIVQATSRYNAGAIILQSAIRKTSDQFAAGANFATIFGEHVGTAAEILEVFATQRAAKAFSAAGSIGEGLEGAGAKAGVFTGLLEGAAGFLAGPWGIALTIGVSALGPLIGRLFDSGNAAKEAAEKGLEEFRAKQVQLAQYIDVTTGKLKDQTAALAKLAGEAIPAQITAQKIAEGVATRSAFSAVQDAIKAAGSSRAGPNAPVLVNAVRGADGSSAKLDDALQAAAKADPRYANLAATVNAYAAQARQAFDAQTGLNGSMAEAKVLNAGGIIDSSKLEQQRADEATATTRLEKAQASLNAVKMRGAAIDLETYSPKKVADLKAYGDQLIAAQSEVAAAQAAQKKTRTPRKPVDHSGDITTADNDAANFIAQYTDAPTFILAAQKAIEKLDADAKALNKDKPKGFADALSAVANAKGVIEDNLDKPYKDFLRTQNNNLQVLKLQAAGQDDQATALQQIIALQTKQIPLDAEHVQGVLDSVTALHKQQDAYALIQQRQSDLQSGLDAYRTTLEGIFTGQEKLAKLPGDLVDTFKQVSGKLAFDQLFGKSFQDLGNEIKGGSGLGGITDQFQDALASVKPPVADFSTDLGKAGSAASTFADAVTAAANRISGSVAAPAGSVTDATSALATDAGTVAPPIVVDGKQPTASQTPVLTALGEIKAVFTSGLKAVGISPESAKLIGNLTGTAIAGAAEGSAVGSLFGSLTGGKSSSIGSSIGGALGEVAGKQLGKSVSGLASLFGDKALGSLGSALGPIGGALGGILGGVIGGLFKKVPTGGATITNSTGDATITGNSSSAESNASSLAGTVQSGLAQIAQQLGGTAGSFGGITIGQYNKSYRVQTDGLTHLGGKNHGAADAVDFGTDEDAAISYAIQVAIARGAVSGLDAAVQKALSSSTDINKSLAEALQVENVEKLIGGIGYTLKQTFATFDATAAANFATAQTYSLDTVALEKQSADARTALIASTLKASVGSLQDFITSETSGDDFEGSAADKRNAQLAQIAALQPKAQAGDQDSIDALASLYQNLLDTSKSAFGTAGTEYTSDRTLATTGAQGVIQSEQDRINTAAGISSDPATTAAVNAGNTLTSESNDLLAVNNAKLDNVTALLTTIAANSSSGNGGLSSTMRVSSL